MVKESELVPEDGGVVSVLSRQVNLEIQKKMVWLLKQDKVFNWQVLLPLKYKKAEDLDTSQLPVSQG